MTGPRIEATAPDRPSPPAAGRRGGVFGAYGPDSESWRLNREATLLLAAGPRALLLQLAHPLIAEGVAQHSRFRDDPWSRLEGTLRSYLRIVYGTEVQARDEIARLDRLHDRVAGPVNDPAARAATGAARYAARDPILELWVHATLVDSTMVAYEAWIEPLSEDRRARFYDETRGIGLGFGIPDDVLPRDLAGFRTYLDRMLGPDGPVEVTPTARDLATTILHPPLGPIVRTLTDAPAGREIEGTGSRDGGERGGEHPAGGRDVIVARLLDAIPVAAYDWLMWPAVELLPPSIRAGYGIPAVPLRRLVSAWLVRGYRLWRPLVPARLRWMPQALAADRRVEGPRHTRDPLASTESG